MIRFHFEDNGQDFLWWDVEDLGDGIGKVVERRHAGAGV